MLVAEDLDLGPYASTKNLLNGVSASNIRFHENLRIKTSPFGGSGLFFEHAVKTDMPSQDLEVLRVPGSSVLDYMTLLHALEDVRSRDETWPGPKPEVLESELIRLVLICVEPQSETEIIIAYLVAFLILRKILDNHSEYFMTSCLRRYDWYLDILCSVNTMVCPPPDEVADNQHSDEFHVGLARTFDELQYGYHNFVDVMREELVDRAPDLDKSISPQVWAQIHLAVRSRTLEIPHRIQKKTSNESTQDKTLEAAMDSLDVLDDPEDFTTNITLVPIIDFANHTNPSNAYFDVDADLGDVILKIRAEKVVAGEFEVMISYSPVECIQQFIQTYGFVPRSDETQVQVFEYYIKDLDNWIPNGKEIAKWLHILPRVQLIKSPNRCLVNLDDSRLPLLLCGNIVLDTEWPEKYTDSIEMVEALKYQRDSAEIDFIMGSDSIPVRFNDLPIEGIDTLQRMVSGDWERLIAECHAKIQSQMNQDLSTLRRSGNYDPSMFGTMMRDYNAFLERFIEDALKDGSLLILESDNTQFSQFRPPPKSLDIF